MQSDIHRTGYRRVCPRAVRTQIMGVVPPGTSIPPGPVSARHRLAQGASQRPIDWSALLGVRRASHTPEESSCLSSWVCERSDRSPSAPIVQPQSGVLVQCVRHTSRRVGGERADMDDETMRKALLQKLSDPEWKARQASRYRQIMGETEIAFTPPASRIRERIVLQNEPMPAEETPGTIEALWMGNWQRSSGALTITRFPDNTIALDDPDGDRTLFQVETAARNRYTWSSETISGAGRQSDRYRCPDRYKDAAEAMLEMHRAALAMYSELAAEREAW
jgi:hypothetical protein